jgi:hypothetical protein
LLIEEGRTNLSLRSEAIVDNIGWILVETTSVVSGTSPNGNSSYQISETNTVSNHLLANAGSNTGTNETSVVSGTSYTGSIFVKKVVGSIDWVQLTFGFAGFGTGQFANFNISNGTVGNYAGLTSGTVPRIEEFPNGWYRCSITATAVATTSSTSNIVLSFINNTDALTRFASYLGSTSNSVLASLCQVEAGSFPTSYIPTTTGTLARSADVCSITGANFNSFYNQPEGTVIVHGDSASGNGSRWCGTGPSLAVRAFELYGKTNLVYFESSGATENSIGAITLPTKFGLACKLNDFQGVRNGTLGGADTNATMPSPTTFHIGSLLGSIEFLNGCIISLRYYRKRLPNAKLAQLTA